MSIASILTSNNEDIYFAEINAGTINCDVLNAKSGGGGTSTTQPIYTSFINFFKSKFYLKILLKDLNWLILCNSAF